MPAVPAGKVLVTGANGYIAVWVVKKLLDSGYAVRGAVRSLSKAKHLNGTFRSYDERFEVAIVDDITKAGAFDDVVKDVDAIVHTASPVSFTAHDPAEVIAPAVSSTLSILTSARTHGTRVRRVVITSSCGAINGPYSSAGPGQSTCFSDVDWNDGEVRECKQKGPKATQMAKYRASKVLAERAAWEFVHTDADKPKQACEFDMTVINPSLVFGPVLHEVYDPENLNWSVKQWFDAVLKRVSVEKLDIAGGTGWVDVRDVATAHVQALQKDAAGGERVIVSAGTFTWKECIATAHAINGCIPTGNEPPPVEHTVYFDTSKSQKVLGMEYISLDQCTEDMLVQFKERWWY